MKTLHGFHEQYEKIMQLDEPAKTNQLATLMTEMEQQYQIPMERDARWEQDYRKVIALYRKVANSRDL